MTSQTYRLSLVHWRTVLLALCSLVFQFLTVNHSNQQNVPRVRTEFPDAGRPRNGPHDGGHGSLASHMGLFGALDIPSFGGAFDVAKI